MANDNSSIEERLLELQEQNEILQERITCLNFMIMTMMHFSYQNIRLGGPVHELIRKHSSESFSPRMQGFIETMLPKLER